MSTAKNLHDQSMDIVEKAILERMRGNDELTTQLYAKALELELAAIDELNKSGRPDELTWAVLHCGASWLALNSNQHRKAEQLASKGLSGDPPPEIAEELRDVWEHANSRLAEKLAVKALARDPHLEIAGDPRDISSRSMRRDISR